MDADRNPIRAPDSVSPSGLLASGLGAGAAISAGECVAIGGTSAYLMIPVILLVGCAGLAAGAAQACFAWGARRMAARLAGRGWPDAAAAALPWAIASAPLCAWLFLAATSGRRLAGMPGRFPLIALGVVVAACSTYLLAQAMTRRRVRLAVTSRGRAVLLGLSCLGIGACLLWLDGALVARRYSWFHLCLQGAAFVVVQGALLLIVRRSNGHSRRHRAWWPIAVGVVLAGGLSGRYLWSTAGERHRAHVFSHLGAVASVLDVVRPLFGAPTPRAVPKTANLAPVKAPVRFSPDRAWCPGCDVVLVTVDALRADHLGAYGYRRPTSPNLDRLAASGAIFERAYSPSPHTSFSLASLLTGRHAFPLARAGMLDGIPTIAEALQAAGYRTVGLFPPAVFFVEGEHFADLERRRYGFQVTRFESLEETQDAVIRTDQAIAALGTAIGTPTFLWIHYFGPHEPYLSHPESQRGSSFGPREIDRYDDEIAWVDGELGRLVSHIRKRGRPTMIVVTADHGEEFGDHGGAYHGTTLFDEQIRVPLIVSVPGGRGARIAAPASTLDVIPTLLGLLGISWPVPQDGTDRSGDITGVASGPPGLVFAELESWKAAISGNRKLVCDVARDFCRLFDLAVDPGERVDVAPKHPREVGDLRRSLQRWLQAEPASVRPGGPPASSNSLLWAAQRADRSAVSGLGSVIGPGTGATVTERRTATRILARAPGPEHHEALEHAWLHDPDSTVRLWAAVGLIALRDHRSLSTLAAAGALLSTDPELASHRALALQAVGNQQALGALTEALPTVSDVNLRCRLLAALGRARHPRATAALIEAYAHIRSRICAAEALAQARDATALPFLSARLADEPYTTVRAAVARALGLIGDRSAIAALEEAFRRETEEVVVAAAARALADLGVGQLVEGRRPLRRPAAATELWLVTEPGMKAPTVRLAQASHRALRAQFYTSVARDAHAFSLPARGTDLLWISGTARFALFR